jgi:hypothetical protein
MVVDSVISRFRGHNQNRDLSEVLKLPGRLPLTVANEERVGSDFYFLQVTGSWKRRVILQGYVGQPERTSVGEWGEYCIDERWTERL